MASKREHKQVHKTSTFWIILQVTYWKETYVSVLLYLYFGVTRKEGKFYFG